MAHEALKRSLGRADLCRFVAACYYQPARQLAEERMFDSLFDAAMNVDSALAPSVQSLAAAYGSDTLDALLVDYTRLFLGPNDILAKPYGSSWLTGEKTLMQDATTAILDLYRDGGFEMDESFRELPDHVAAELEFLYLVLFRRAQARHSGDERSAGLYDGLHRRLLTEHLGRWVEPFTTAIAQHARTSFYRSLAEVTRLVVIGEVRAIPSPLTSG